MMCFKSIRSEQIACEDLFPDIVNIRRHPIGVDDVTCLLERRQIANHGRTEERILLHSGFVDYDLDTLGLDPLHDTLNGRLAEIIGIRVRPR